ncbi:MAG: type II secretion system F family protein [Desulfobacterales bacterium]
MPSFTYKAIDDAGKILRGSVIALGEKDAEQRIAREGLTLITLQRLRDRLLENVFTRLTVKPRLLIELYRRLSQTLEMGLPIVTALEENAKVLPSRTLKRVLSEIRLLIESGQSLHDSISHFPKIFGKLDLGIIHMGEQTGVMPKCLNDLADFHEWKEDIRSTIKKAAIYPSFILLALGAVIGVWVGYVLPQMAVLLKEMGVTIPAATQVVLAISNFIRAYWALMIGGIAAGAALFILVQRNRKGAVAVHKYVLRIPLLGQVVKNIALARMCHYFSTMFKAGMSIGVIFEILADGVLGNKYLESRLYAAYRKIQLGRGIAESFEKTGGFPLLLVGGIKNGETTGTLDDTFARLGDYYDKEVKRTVQALLGSIEPLTIILLGSVFGLIILSILLPLYDVFSDLGKAY